MSICLKLVYSVLIPQSYDCKWFKLKGSVARKSVTFFRDRALLWFLTSFFVEILLQCDKLPQPPFPLRNSQTGFVLYSINVTRPDTET